MVGEQFSLFGLRDNHYQERDQTGAAILGDIVGDALARADHTDWPLLH